MSEPEAVIRHARADEMPTVRVLFVEYAAALGVDLCFQDFDTELATLPGKYAPPGGVILLGEWGGAVAGVVALRPLDAKVAEMKRLFVRPEARGSGLGRRLALAVIKEARQAGYHSIRLDTLPQMVAAQELYRSLGFHETEAYYQNPHGAIYLELALTQ